MLHRPAFFRIFRLLLSCLFLLLPLSAPRAGAAGQAVSGDPDAPGYLERAWTTGRWPTETGEVTLAAADVDQDGTLEILNVGPYRWKVISYSATRERYEAEYISKYSAIAETNWPALGCSAAADFGPGAGYRIFISSVPNRLEVYDGASRRLLASAYFPLNSDSYADHWCSRMVVADIDQDGTLEIIARSGNLLVALNAVTLEQEWSASFSGYYGTLAVGNTDNDLALEIVLDDRMIDGATHQVEWRPVNGLGGTITLADVDGDGRDEVIALKTSNDLAVLDADTQLYQWILHTIGNEHQMQGLAAADIDQDGRAEILVGSFSQNGSIYAYDGVSQALKKRIPNPENTVKNLAAGDSDGDGAVEVIWGTGAHLFVADPLREEIEWESPDTGYFSRVGAGDIDADGQMEIAAAACYVENGLNGMPVVVFDAATKAAEWAGPFATPFDTWQNGCPSNRAVAVANIDQDPALELIFPVATPQFPNDYSRIAAYDGQTHRLEWEWDSPTGTSYYFDSLRAADVDLDGQVEVLASGSAYVSYPASPFVAIFDPAANKREWLSLALGTYGYGSESAVFAVCNLDSDPALELVTFSTSGKMTVFDGQSHQQQWAKAHYAATAFTCGDADQDGKDEVLVSLGAGSLEFLDGATGDKESGVQLPGVSKPVKALRLADFEGDGSAELLVVVQNSLWVVSLPSGPLLWQSQGLGWLNYTDWWAQRVGEMIAVKDVDGDGLSEVLVGSDNELTLFRYNPEAAQNLPLTASLTADRYLAAPGGVLTYQATLTNQAAAPRDFQVTIPLAGGSLQGAPQPSTGTLALDGAALKWTLSLGPYARGALNFSLAAPAAAPDGADFTLNAHFLETASAAAVYRSATAQIDATLPHSSVDSPASLSVVTGSQTVLGGTAGDDHLVARVEVSIDQGGWLAAQGTASWTFPWTLPGDGRHNIRSRAIDAAGNVENPGAGIDLYVSNQGPQVQALSPADGSSGVWDGEPLRVQFNIPVRPETLSAACSPAVIFKPAQAGSDPAGLVLYHSLFPLGQRVTCTINAVWSTQEQPLAAPVSWSFQVSPSASRIYLPGSYR